MFAALLSILNRSMLSDRPYMRDPYERSPFSAINWLICIIAGGFIVENIFLRWFSGNVAAWFLNHFTLYPNAIGHGYLWTLFSHALFHDPNGLLQLGFTLLSLFVFGRAVVTEIGARRVLILFIVAVAAGGLTWLGVNWTHDDRLFGASAGVCAIIVVFAFLMPDQPITIFTIDIGMRAKHFAIALLIIDSLGLVLLEIPGRTSWFEMAHSAHLGGMLAGWIYYKFFHQHEWSPLMTKPAIELPRWFRKSRKADAPAPAYKVNLGSGEDLRAEIDRILDKINSEGFQSLTAEEKRRLDHARDHLSRR